MTTPDELAESVRHIHSLEYDEMHPDVGAIMDAICGPIDPLTHTRNTKQGMKGEIADISKRMTDLHENGRVRFSTGFKAIAGTTVAGIFALLAVLLQHVLGG